MAEPKVRYLVNGLDCRDHELAHNLCLRFLLRTYYIPRYGYRDCRHSDGQMRQPVCVAWQAVL
jgi:hypothetical protein